MGSVHLTLSLPLLPPQWEDSSHSATAPAWGPSHKRQSSMDFSNVSPSHRLQFFRNCSSVAPFYGVQSFRNRLLQCGILHRLQVDICATIDLHGLQEDSLPHHGLLHGLQGNLCSSAWRTSSFFFTDLAVCRVVSITYSHLFLLLQNTQIFFVLLKYLITEALPLLLMGSALASVGSFLEPAAIDPIRHREASSSSSQKPPL